MRQILRKSEGRLYVGVITRETNIGLNVSLNYDEKDGDDDDMSLCADLEKKGKTRRNTKKTAVGKEATVRNSCHKPSLTRITTRR